MRKILFVMLIGVVLILSGCSNTEYSKNFVGIPIYEGANEVMSDDTGEGYTEIYSVNNSNIGFGEVVDFYMENIDKDIWDIEESKDKPAGNVDKIKQYGLTHEDKKVILTLTYSDSDNMEPSVNITLSGDRISE
ncbi:hypothetical protein GOQ27_01160 [Clostridium sp. D2Q-11]|uniref:Uncharacterized protein n=1 Tax=Anaeromonas frigoriresistens TaxID=2683708 RepID=A0A942UUJ8_9FIRM|nr:hypothetical protein [Anaeromonas frigoriresistens]MBS4537049.1 hypothetical protein [Anaeromonas frigoriresistens]